MASGDIFPVSFHFLVDFQKLGEHFQVSFSEISGLDIQLKREGKLNAGGNRVVLPGEQSLGNITLKRSIAPMGTKDAFTTWVNKTFTPDKGKFIIAYDAIIKLLDAEGKPIAGWKCSYTYPTYWSLSTMDAEKSELAIETVTLTCNRIERIT
nr:MAG TPA: tail tube protein [Caudoviricetes sp.]